MKFLGALTIICILACASTACSPAYVIRAGWEEARILMRREKISDVINNPQTTKDIRNKLELVSDARAYAVSSGLKAKKSYLYFTSIDRKVLVWVLTAAPKYSLKPYTWWYPIVGNMPYKGFFEKKDAIDLAKDLSSEGLDTAIRPSLAFSTLGWFNDPLLSTMFNLSNNDLVDTVIHELVHNTVWAPNYVAFNESLANVAGGLGAIEYFSSRYGKNHPKTLNAKNLWKDQMRYAKFLNKFIASLEELYQKGPDGDKSLTENKIIEARKELFAKTKAKWAIEQQAMLTTRYRNIDRMFNNAALIGVSLYFTKLESLVALYKISGGTLKQFIIASKECVEIAKQKGLSPFEIIEERVNSQLPHLD